MIDPAARARLERWKQSLLDPADPLLAIGDRELPIADTDPIRLAFALATGGTFALGSGGADDGRLRIALPARELARRLTALRRLARDRLADGDHALWLALGQLAWRDRDATNFRITIDAGTMIAVTSASDHEM